MLIYYLFIYCDTIAIRVFTVLSLLQWTLSTEIKGFVPLNPPAFQAENIVLWSIGKWSQHCITDRIRSLAALSLSHPA